jgi:sugar lactone lactonase YvrE
MRKSSLKLAADVKAALGEGPVWDDRTKRIYWLDILGKRIYRLEEGSADFQYDQLDTLVGAAVPRDSGGFVMATQQGFSFYDEVTKELTSISDPERDLPDNRFNDGKCDPAGRFIAGTMSMKDQRNAGSLYQLDSDLLTHTLVRGVSTSNGLAWSHEGTMMYYIDTPTHSVVAYEYDVETGRLGKSHEIIHIAHSEGAPDGMTIDAEGCLWIAHWGGSQVTRWDPAKGERLDSIPLPVPLVTSCTFGGINHDELYITTARIGLNEQQLEDYPLSGSLFSINPGVSGFKTYTFKG